MSDSETDQVDHRSFRFSLDLTREQEISLRRHTGAARFAYNYAIGLKVAAHERYSALVAEAAEHDLSGAQAKAWVRTRAGKLPRKRDVQVAFLAERGNSLTGVSGVAPWWHEVSTYAFQAAWLDADAAWQNWLDSLSGKRKGPRVGYPRFKSRRRARQSVRFYGKIRLDGLRRLRLPRVGSVRLHGNNRRLTGFLDAHGGRIQVVRVSRTADRWYATVVVESRALSPALPTRRQRQHGLVGVDLGVRYLATLSTGETFANPRPLEAARRQLHRAEQALARCEAGSQNRERARLRLAKVHRLVAERRATALHELTKHLAAEYAVVAIEDISVAIMFATTPAGIPARVQSRRREALADVSLAAIRRQLAYKTTWYGSRLIVIDAEGVNSECSGCGALRELVPPSRPEFHCSTCGSRLPRGLNSAKVIAARAAAQICAETKPGG